MLGGGTAVMTTFLLGGFYEIKKTFFLIENEQVRLVLVSCVALAVPLRILRAL